MVCCPSDVALMKQAVNSHSRDLRFDLNGDGQVTAADAMSYSHSWRVQGQPHVRSQLRASSSSGSAPTRAVGPAPNNAQRGEKIPTKRSIRRSARRGSRVSRASMSTLSRTETSRPCVHRILRGSKRADLPVPDEVIE